jgi:hypothetical protein
MAFVGPNTPQNIGQNVWKTVDTGGLLAFVGAFDPLGVQADSGLVTTDLTTTPAGAITIPTTFGPGEGNWTQADVDAVDVILNDQTPAPAPGVDLAAYKALVGGNLQVGVHNRGIAPAILVEVALDAQHTIGR